MECVIVVMVSRVSAYIQTHQIVYIKYVLVFNIVKTNYTIGFEYQLYLSKAVNECFDLMPELQGISLYASLSSHKSSLSKDKSDPVSSCSEPSVVSSPKSPQWPRTPPPLILLLAISLAPNSLASPPTNHSFPLSHLSLLVP